MVQQIRWVVLLVSSQWIDGVLAKEEKDGWSRNIATIAETLISGLVSQL
jgi:hypothetical protein